MNIEPYLFFNGRCDEAMAFYAALGAQPGVVLRHRDNPAPVPEGAVPAGWEDKVMHATMRIGDTTVMMSDGNADVPAVFDGFRLALNVADAAAANKAFHALSEGGRVDVPLGATFFSPRFGMVTDRFGVGWIVVAAP